MHTLKSTNSVCIKFFNINKMHIVITFTLVKQMMNCFVISRTYINFITKINLRNDTLRSHEVKA